MRKAPPAGSTVVARRREAPGILQKTVRCADEPTFQHVLSFGSPG
jgi:hypothetical protein